MSISTSASLSRPILDRANMWLLFSPENPSGIIEFRKLLLTTARKGSFSLSRYNIVSFRLSLASANRNSPLRSAYHLMIFPGFLATNSLWQASVRRRYTSNTDESRSLSEIKNPLSITLDGDIQRSLTVDGGIRCLTPSVARLTANTCKLSLRLSLVKINSSSFAQKQDWTPSSVSDVIRWWRFPSSKWIIKIFFWPSYTPR